MRELSFQSAGSTVELCYHSLLLEGEGWVVEHHGVHQQHLPHIVEVGGRGGVLCQQLVQQRGAAVVPGAQQGCEHYQLAARPLL